jgi:hypothetical protein
MGKNHPHTASRGVTLDEMVSNETDEQHLICPINNTERKSYAEAETENTQSHGQARQSHWQW